MISDKNRNPGNLDVTTLMSGNLDHSPSSSPWEPGSPSTHEYINPIYFCWHTFRMLSHLKNIHMTYIIPTNDEYINQIYLCWHTFRTKPMKYIKIYTICVKFNEYINQTHLPRGFNIWNELNKAHMNLQQNSSSTNQQGSKRHYCDQSQDLPPPLPLCDHCVHGKDVVNFSF